MENKIIQFKEKFGFSSSTLKVIAMITMLFDHLWGTIIKGNLWLTVIGRITLPIFAFQVAEGFCKTSNKRKYAMRVFIFALISEIPFNFMMSGNWFYPFHQNVLFGFLIAIGAMWIIEWVKKKNCWYLTILIELLVILGGFTLATLAMVDYQGFVVLTVLLFYLFRNYKFAWLGQLIGMFVINYLWLGGQTINFTLLGNLIEFPIQATAMLALIPIWLYNGKKGFGGKKMQYFVYAFYPLHIAILVIIANFLR
ncbi:MAG: TraX family protein [Oscillospiraceae bacterium]